MKKLMKKLGKWAIVYVVVDTACGIAGVALLAWYYSPWWPL